MGLISYLIDLIELSRMTPKSPKSDLIEQSYIPSKFKNHRGDQADFLIKNSKMGLIEH